MLSLIGSLVSFIWDVNLSLQARWLEFPVGRRGDVGFALRSTPELAPSAKKAVIGL